MQIAVYSSAIVQRARENYNTQSYIDFVYDEYVQLESRPRKICNEKFRTKRINDEPSFGACHDRLPPTLLIIDSFPILSHKPKRKTIQWFY